MRRKWLPDGEDHEDDFGLALYLEQEYWEGMTMTVANGISKALAE